MHPSKSTTVPVIVFIVLLCDLPLPSTTSSTRSPRSCHVTVAGDRIALPASMTRRPAVVAGPVDSAGTPQSAYTTGGQASAPCQHSYRASILRGTDQHELPWLGNAVPTASSTPSASSGSGGIRQSDGLLRVARRRRFHVTLVAIGSRLDHEASDNSFRGTSPPRPLPSPQGNDICNRNRLSGDRPRDRVRTSSTLKGAFSNIKEARGAVPYENVFLGWHACAARSSPSRWRAPLARSAPADSTSR